MYGLQKHKFNTTHVVVGGDQYKTGIQILYCFSLSTTCSVAFAKQITERKIELYNYLKIFFFSLKI
jgi:hypothetical protein